MSNIVIVIVLAVILGTASLHLYKQKKRGARCIGCPAGCNCEKSHKNEANASGCSCGCGK